MTEQKEKDFEFDLEPAKSITFYAAGIQFRKDWKNRLATLSAEAELYLIPEPTNKYDKNAVKILSTELIFLGYVPAKGDEVAKNVWVLDRLFEGQRLRATAQEINTELDPWQALLVKVEIVEAALKEEKNG